MASLPSPTQVAGKHNGIYEAYYKQVDPKGMGTIEAMNAANFLKKSGLSDVVLSRIWDLSDPKGRGCLDKAGVFVALKLVSLAQAGHDISMRNIFMETSNPPKVGDIPKIIPQTIQSVSASNADWTMKVTDRLKYEQLFESQQPVNGLIAGNKVKGVLMDSKLPLDTLGKIWDLADQDKDGSLDKHEFTVAMHLVYQALDKRAVPSTLPSELLKPKSGASVPRAPSGEGFGDVGFVANFPKDIPPPPVPPLPAILPITTQPPISRVPQSVPSMPLISTDPIAPAKIVPPLSAPSTSTDWVVLPTELIRFESIFRDCDRDRDGLVSGLEVKNVFLQSGVPQNCLAHIWALCDTNQSGKLTLEQFALAMWMVERKKIGIEPPEGLSPNMIPPSLRGAVQGVDLPQIQQEPQPTYANPELEMISKEIEELSRERRVLETDISQKEADIRIKSGEVRSLQSELDTLTATLKQLENQKGEAQKRLDDLKAQSNDVNGALASINNDIEVKRQQVDKIREQCRKQEETINEQEGELNSKRSELQKLKDEEAALEKEYDSNRKELDNLTKQLQDTQLQISQVKAMVTQLLESQRQMNDALLLCKAAIEANDAALLSDYSLKIEPDFREAKETLEKLDETPKNDPFNEKDVSFSGEDNFVSNGFTSDPFSNGTKTGTAFDDNFGNAQIPGFDDAFGSRFSANQTKDPFGSSTADPFGDKKATAITPEPGKDDFGSDPFAILHAPTSAGQILSPNTTGGQKSGPPPRPESPSPALPPKKSKQPPPRPAPPRPLQGPTRPAPPVSSNTDAFGSSMGGFADFADFDNKQPSLVPSPTPQMSATLPKIQVSTTPTKKQSKRYKSTTVPTIAAVPAAPTDFRDDPFKDYRYEDPFSIKDPFADDDDEDDASSEDDSKKTEIFTNQNTIRTQQLGDFIDNFKISSVPSDGSNRSQGSTPLNVMDNFADFDAFGNTSGSINNNNSMTSTTPAISSSSTITTKTSNTHNSTFEDFFFDTFNDNFKAVDNKNLKSKTSVFDAFGDSKNLTTDKTTKSSKVFDDFNDNFDDSFFKMKISGTSELLDSKSNENFATFDEFGDDFAGSLNNAKIPTSNKVQNNVKIKNNSNDGVSKLPEKFVEDYSQGDKFDADLQAVLQRSIRDK